MDAQIKFFSFETLSVLVGEISEVFWSISFLRVLRFLEWVSEFWGGVEEIGGDPGFH